MIVGESVTAGDSLSYSLADNPEIDWAARWFELTNRLARLRSLCVPGSKVNRADLKRETEDYFVACNHIADWLKMDPRLDVLGITDKVVEDFVASEQSLEICRGVANTVKHADPKSNNRFQARIVEFHSGPDGLRQTLEYRSSIQQAQTVEALELAERCHDDWERFLKAQALV